jgi:uncharacterized membrane-anchored protein
MTAAIFALIGVLVGGVVGGLAKYLAEYHTSRRASHDRVGEPDDLPDPDLDTRRATHARGERY